MDMSIKTIVKDAISKIESQKSLALEAKKAELRNSEANPQICKLQDNFDRTVEELRIRLEEEKRLVVEKCDFKAVKEVNAEYDSAIDGLRKLLPSEE